mgnify:FL=1
MSVVFVSLTIVLASYIVVVSLEHGNEQANSQNTIFEVFSAFGTVGLTANLTTTLSVGSRIIICILMFFGRLGPIYMFQIFQQNMDREESKHFKHIETDVIIG